MRKLVFVFISVALVAAVACSSSSRSVTNPAAPSMTVTGSGGAYVPMGAETFWADPPLSPGAFFLTGTPTLKWDKFNKGDKAQCAIYSGDLTGLTNNQIDALTPISSIWNKDACEHGSFALGSPITVTTKFTFVDSKNGFPSNDTYQKAMLTVEVKTLCQALTGTWKGPTTAVPQDTKGHHGEMTATFPACEGNTINNVSLTWKSTPGSIGYPDTDSAVTYIGTATVTSNGFVDVTANTTSPNPATHCGLGTGGDGSHIHAQIDAFTMLPVTTLTGGYDGQVCTAQHGTFSLTKQ